MIAPDTQTRHWAAREWGTTCDLYDAPSRSTRSIGRAAARRW